MLEKLIVPHAKKLPRLVMQKLPNEIHTHYPIQYLLTTMKPDT